MSALRSLSPAKSLALLLLVNLALLAGVEGLSALALKCMGVHGKAGRDDLPSEFNLFDPMVGWVHPANSRVRGPRRTWIHTDGNGFSAVPGNPGEAAITVVVTGGSAMFGIGSSGNGTTVPALLRGRLQTALGAPVCVVNLGTRGYNSYQEMLLLHRYLERSPASMVVSVSGRNDSADVRDATLADAVLGENRRMEMTALVRRAQAGEPVVMNIELWLQRHSYTARLMADLLKRLRSAAAQAPESARQPRADIRGWVKLSLSHYAMMDAECRVRDIPYVMILQPTAYSKVPLSDEERRAIRSDEDDPPVVLEERIRARAAFYEMFDALPKPFAFRNMNLVFHGNTNTLYVDDCHYNDLGADVLAEAIAREIVPHVRHRPFSGDPGRSMAPR